MTPSENILWTKLQAFQFEEPGLSFPFAARLARENGWTNEYSLRVIDEYKKFIFLCCVSETGVTPPDAVDQAWHLHLTYTRSYWTDLCKNLLNKEIHHNPTKGGQQEAWKFDQFYTGSQLLYKEKFGYEPPKDVWPDNDARFSDIAFQRVNLKKHWLLKKPLLSKKSALVICMLLTGVMSIQAFNENKITILVIVLISIPIIIAIVKSPGRRNSRNTGGADGSGCGTSGCGTSDGHHSSHHTGDSGCNSGCSGSGCSGCGGGGD